MVTVETTKDILFVLQDCVSGKFIELVGKLLPLPPQIIKLKRPIHQLLEFCPTRTFPLLKSGDEFISGTLPIVNYLIKSAKDDSDGIILDNRKILLGRNLKEEARVDMWTHYIFTSILPITSEIEAQLYGKKRFNSEVLEIAINDLLEVLKTVNEQLKLNTFLTSNNIQLSDLMLTSVLFHCYNDVLTKDKIEKIPNVIRVFKFVSHLKYFVDIFGEAIPCNKRKDPLPYVEQKEVEDNADHKKGKKDKKNKKQENKEENKDEENKEEGKSKKKKKDK
jgi:glutathione S-transferase